MVTEDDVQRTMKTGPAQRIQVDSGSVTGLTGTAGEDYVRIEQVAARTGLTKRTLRYYEEIGLLAPPSRTEGGYRLYSERDVQELERIKRLKDLLGFSLKEIREMARAEEEREHVRAAWARETDPHARLEWVSRLEKQSKRLMQLVEEKQAGLAEMHRNLLARYERQRALRAELEAQLGESSGC